MKQSLRVAARVLALTILLNLQLLACNATWCDAAVNGALRQVGSQQVLNLWGSNYQMGYAHGYLMADRIRDLIEHFMIGMKGITAYNNLVSRGNNSAIYQWRQPYLEELSGMADGMAASGKSLFVTSLQRNIDIRDLKAFNMQDEYVFGCSSLAVWGNAAAAETLLARNFDFSYDSQGNFVNYQLIIAYEPDGKSKFYSVAWPGMVGVYSGMNESGVSVAVNTGNGSNSTVTPYHPIAETFRTTLESTTAGNYLSQPLAVSNGVNAYIPEILLLGIPYTGSGSPAYVLEDATGTNVIRYPSDSDPGYSHIIATNHFLKALPPPSSGNSLTRYNTIRSGLLSLYGSGDGKASDREVWDILIRVANVVAPTITTMILRPDSRELDLSFARLSGGTFTPSAWIVPQTYTWEMLFPPRSLADLTIESMSAAPQGAHTGEPVVVTVNIKNQGSVDAGAFYIDFYRNSSSPPSPGQVGDASCTGSGLAAGAVMSCSFTSTFSSPGTYQTWAQIDTSQQVPESQEGNNVAGPLAIVVSSSGPVAVNDSYSIASGAVLSVAPPGVLANDAGTMLAAATTAPPSHGTLLLNADGSFSYAPVAGYVGSDRFTYTASDGSGEGLPATVTIAVTSDDGTLFSDEFTPSPQTADPPYPWETVRGSWSTAAGSLQGTSPPQSYGTIFLQEIAAGDYSVEGRLQLPSGSFGGGIGGRVQAQTGARYGAWIYPSGSVGGSNLLKLVKFRDWTTWSGTAMQQVSIPEVGTGWHSLRMSFRGNRIQVFYDGNLLISTTDSGYDSRGAYLSGGITADVWSYTSPSSIILDYLKATLPSGDAPPAAADDSFSTAAGTVLTRPAPGILLNDSDPEGETLSAQLVALPQHGELTLNADGSFTYAPSAGFSGTDSFTYRAFDGAASSNVATVTVTVVQTLTLASLSLTPATVTGGGSVQGTLTLSGAAPEGGVVVSLSDNSSAVVTPSAVTVAAGSSSATFTLSTSPVSTTRTVTVSASWGGSVRTATLTVARPVLKTLTLNPASVPGGSASVGTVTLSGAAPSGGMLVSLSDNSSSASVPTGVTVAAGSSKATFTVTTYRVSSTRSATISASAGGVSRSAILQITR